MTATIRRRQCLVSMLSAGATALTGCATTPARTRTYVLVHGAWHGAWAWEAVKPLLESSGARVHAPTLAGLAERQRENGPNVTLDTHIDEIVSLLDRQQLSDIVLVGHSYAGMVVSGVCDRRPERIAHVVYLDAFLPESGQNLYDMVNSAQVEANRRMTREKGDGYKAFPPPAAAWGLTGDLMDSVNRRMTPHPAMTLEQPLHLKRGGPYAVSRRTYVACNNPALPPFEPIKARLKVDPRWTYIAVDTAGHEVALSHPQLLADILSRR
jgi:pimeloyl-ACP methyl ester carboxylesterase